MISAVVALTMRGPAKFPAPNDKSIFEQSPCFQISKQACDRLIDRLGIAFQSRFEIEVLIPVAMSGLDKADTCFDELTRHETLFSKGVGFCVIDAAHGFGSSGCLTDIQNFRNFGLHSKSKLAGFDHAFDLGTDTAILSLALRFTVKKSRRAYVSPATHFASPHKDENLPPMGMRVRLKACFDTSKFTGAAKVILEGLKTHGMILADNGGNWFICGAPDDRWNHEELLPIRKVKGKELEVVKMGPMTTR